MILEFAAAHPGAVIFLAGLIVALIGEVFDGFRDNHPDHR